MVTEARTPPQDQQAERSVLGALLLSKNAQDEIMPLLSGADFYVPAHGALFAAIADMYAKGRPVDVTTILPSMLADHGNELRALGGGTYLHTLIEAVPTVANASYYAAIVRDRAMLRAIVEAGTQIVQRAYTPSGEAGYEIAEWAAAHIATVRDTGLLTEDLPTPTVEDLLAEHLDFDWAIPGLMERGDRLVLSGVEGLGKSTLTRAIAASAAAGLHPFTHAGIEPLRVLHVDLENGARLSQRRYRDLERAAAGMGRSFSGRLHVELRPSGLDVSRQADARWLLRRVERIQPDLLVIGPVYRLSDSDPNEEKSAREVTQVLDRCRAVNGCALIAETHSPHGSNVGIRPVRPIGSSLWLRWPEFGYGIRPADAPDAKERRLVDFIPWRGPRDERTWPEQLEAGKPWPWVEARPSYASRWGAA